GNYEKDLIGNRSMRIFNDTVGINVARNTDNLIIQTYPRDTGEVISDIGVPVFYRRQTLWWCKSWACCGEYIVNFFLLTTEKFFI
ncbi:hypothetical protein, partial [Acidithiobacillus sp.]|uniref:hypothetical protein n=1 Tax=Acidithiobacillus sp. TaxID=1872118 RepID=UPI003D00C8B9